MNLVARGPTGAARLPPDWLAACSLPLMEIPAQSTFVRIHHSHRPAVFFSPGDNKPAAGRFDSATGLFGVLYVALDYEGAFAETVLRNPARRLFGFAEFSGRSLSVLALSRAVRLVRMHGSGLQVLGLDNAISTGPYEPCGIWADALFAHADRPDGIAYSSRHDPDKICVALFSRTDIVITVASGSIPLHEMLTEVSAALRRYGKGLEADI